MMKRKPLRRAACLPRSPQSAARIRWQPVLFFLLGLVVLLGVYSPALNGGFVWDDDAWTTKLLPLFTTSGGLVRIWANDPLLQQYYPLTASTFWLDWQLWKGWTLPYHVENVLLHGFCAGLLGLVLTRLRLPGAWLAAAVFAFHPVMVESVAWITERKNSLSLAFTLAALLAYSHAVNDWQPDQRLRLRPWVFALLFCLGALLAKVTAFVLPPALLLIAWWKHGRLQWRRDVLPVLPFFLVAFALGSFVWWLESCHVGAEGGEFQASITQRILSAGRACWFYLWKLLWPSGLSFIYPDWRTQPAQLWHWLFPLSIPAILFTTWFLRGRIGRGPLVAQLLYLGAIFPVSGILNVYGALFSPVWDHWVYVPAIALIAPLCAVIATRVKLIVCLPVVALLAALSWQQSAQYIGKEELWLETIRRNPEAWIAQTNHGIALSLQGRHEEGARFLRQAIEVRPHYPKAYANLGGILLRQGDHAGAIEAYEKAMQQDPSLTAFSRYNIGGAMLMMKRQPEALEQLHASFALDPTNTQALTTLKSFNSVPEPLPAGPTSADHIRAGLAALQGGRTPEAAGRFLAALDLDPQQFDAAYNYADLLLQQGRAREAVPLLDEALRQQPDHSLARHNRAIAAAQLGQFAVARRFYEEVLVRDPSQVGSSNNLAWLLATCPDEQVRDGAKAVILVQNALAKMGNAHPVLARTLAAALAECHRFDEAVTTAQTALEAATRAGSQPLADSLREHLDRYRLGKPVREGAVAN
jgi:tetratricopeptide (TPR) repeat protein